MRLIDADALYKKMMSWCIDDWNKSIMPYGASEVILEMVEDAPTIDAVEVVRCGACTHWMVDTIFGHGWCDKGKRRDNPNWFCADGERREDE